ncbi:TetR/AcrR family transcriptional regulator [Streptomyces sp. NPDC058464]|uniref:TetR/AcrR family transcriptional regulator n=1 Tax=Streptomyces sp. NPDC058464 TaxID=3346511 RepID=UPI003658A950
MTTPFQRARSEPQRALRRQAILDTAAAMLTEMPVAQVSLNELSRRVGLAKSNVLRYFESREAVLLELLDTACHEWLDHLGADLRSGVDMDAEAMSRGDQVAAVLAATLTERPVLCDLVNAQASVLERNVSARAAAEYKHASNANTAVLAGLVRERIPELGEYDALRFAGATFMTTGAVWIHAHPSAAVIAAYEADPDLAAARLDFIDALRQTLEVLLSGLLARAAHADSA